MALSKLTAAGRIVGQRACGWLLLACLAAGCSRQPIYAVHGQLTDVHGEAITGMKGGVVEFESMESKASANGGIDEDGAFSLTTETPDDGAYIGKHRVAITRPYLGPEQPAPYVIDPKYENFSTSGLEVTVEPRDNEIQLKVERYVSK